jgi:hypothetical protein
VAGIAALGAVASALVVESKPALAPAEPKPEELAVEPAA